MKIKECPECSSETEKYTVVSQLPLSYMSIVEIEVYCCTICDWMTCNDWKQIMRENFGLYTVTPDVEYKGYLIKMKHVGYDFEYSIELENGTCWLSGPYYCYGDCVRDAKKRIDEWTAY